MKKVSFYLVLVSLFVSQNYKIGMVEWIGYAGNNVAEAKGFWKDKGLNVTVNVYKTTKELHSAFKSNEIDIMHNTLASGLKHYFEGEDVAILMQTGYSEGGDKVIIKRGKKLEDLKGSTILLYDNDPSIMYFLNKVFEKRDVKLSDFKYESYEPGDGVNKFVSGSSEILMSYDPHSLRALKSGNGEIISSTKEFKSAIPEGWIMKREKYNTVSQEDFNKLFSGWVKASEWINKKSNFKELFKILRTKTLPSQDIGFRDAQTMLKGVKFLSESQVVRENKRDIVDYFSDLKTFLEKRNELKKPFNPSYIVQTKPLITALD